MLRPYSGLPIALFVLLAASDVAAAPITFDTFDDLGRPNYDELRGSILDDSQSLAESVSELVQAKLGIETSSRLFEALGVIGEIADAVETIGTIMEVSEASSLGDIARAITDDFGLADEVSNAGTLRSTLRTANREFEAADVNDLVPSLDVSIGVVLDQGVRDRATQTLSELISALSKLNADHADVLDLISALEKAEGDADAMGQVAQARGEALLEIAADPLSIPFNILIADLGAKLILADLSFDELSSVLSDALTEARQLESKMAASIEAVRIARSDYLRDLGFPIAQTQYVFSGPSIGNSACGYDISFAPNNFSQPGLSTLPSFIVGAINVFSRPDFDGVVLCNGTLDFTVERTVTGIPSLGTIVTAGNATLPYLYSVLLGTGFDNITMPSLGQGGTIPVGSSRTFLIKGAIESPFRITGLLPGPGEPSDSVFQVPEPASMALFAAGLAGLGWMSRRRKAA